MDPFAGIEVGAEVELNDGSNAAEDPADIRVENKQDLPLWQNLHYFDESSSDESLDHEMPSPEDLKDQEMASPGGDLKSEVEVEIEDDLDENVSAITTTEDPQPIFMYVNDVQKDDQFVVWNNTINKDLQDQPYQLATRFEETGVSCFEVSPTIDFVHLPPSYSTEVYTQIISPHEEPPMENLGKYSYFNTKTQFTGSVKPWRKSHKCQQCGRRFGRLYNLENHKCINMCLGSPQQNIVNIETMNRLEKMCAEAQKELHNLQGHYKKEHVGGLVGALGESCSSDAQTLSQEVLSDPLRCHRCGLHCKNRYHLYAHDCDETSSLNLTVPETNVIIDVLYSDLENQKLFSASEAESTNPHLDEVKVNFDSFSQNGETFKGSNEAAVFYKCLECGDMFDKRCSIAGHLRWHAKEKCSTSSVGYAGAEPLLGIQKPDAATSQHVGLNLVGHQKPDGTSQHIGSSPVGHQKLDATFQQIGSSPIDHLRTDYMNIYLDPDKEETPDFNQNHFFQHSEATKGSNKVNVFYKCQECGKMFDRRCSITNHLRWHSKERYLISSVGNAVVEPSPEVQKPEVTFQDVGHEKDSVSTTKSAQSFTCEYCGGIFNKHCSYVSHIFWHLKDKGSITANDVQEVNNKVDQVPLILIREQESDGKCASPIEICTCQSCGRVFHKVCNFVSHTCGTIEEQEGQQRMMEAQVFLVAGEDYSGEGCDTRDVVDENNMVYDGDSSKEESGSCHDDGNFQGYCNLVRQLSLDEQQKVEEPGCNLLPTTTEPYQPQPPEVLAEEPGRNLPIPIELHQPQPPEVLAEEPGCNLPIPIELHQPQPPEVLAEELCCNLPLPIELPQPPEVLAKEPGCNLPIPIELNQPQPLEVLAEEPGCNLLPTPTEPNQPQPPEVLESIFELIVGTEEVCEMLLGKGSHIPPKEEDSDVGNNAVQVKPKTEPAENRSLLPFIFPSHFVTQLLNRPNLPHRCRDCDIRFHQSWRMKRHRFKVPGNRCALRTHRCDCGKTPIGSLHFLLHQLQHLRDTPFICAVCGKRLRGYRQLQAHSWVHRLASHFQCQCGTRFTRLPRYLWHSLLNNAKARPKAQLGRATRLQTP